MRAILVIGGGFVLVAGLQLYVLSEHTDYWFAWTIEPALTAAFLGAFYLDACVLALFSARERAWDRARVGVQGVLAFIWLTLLATLIHLDKFHLDDGRLIPTAAAWIWLTIYVLEPPVLSVVYPLQLRSPGGDGPGGGEIPRWFRVGSAAIGALLVIVGAILFVAPSSAGDLWAWTLTPLTARAAAAWLVGQGLVLVTIARDGDWLRARWAFLSIIGLVVLQGVALARYPGTFELGGAPGMAFVAVLAILLAGSCYGWLAARRASSPSR